MTDDMAIISLCWIFKDASFHPMWALLTRLTLVALHEAALESGLLGHFKGFSAIPSLGQLFTSWPFKRQVQVDRRDITSELKAFHSAGHGSFHGTLASGVPVKYPETYFEVEQGRSPH